VEACEDNNLDRVRAGAPDVIIVDMGIASRNLTLTLLQKFPGVTLIGLDPESDRLLVLSVQHQTALAAADLVKVIQHPQPNEED
jgi:trans-aconitate methyltransferase